MTVKLSWKYLFLGLLAALILPGCYSKEDHKKYVLSAIKEQTKDCKKPLIANKYDADIGFIHCSVWVVTCGQKDYIFHYEGSNCVTVYETEKKNEINKYTSGKNRQVGHSSSK